MPGPEIRHQTSERMPSSAMNSGSADPSVLYFVPSSRGGIFACHLSSCFDALVGKELLLDNSRERGAWRLGVERVDRIDKVLMLMVVPVELAPLYLAGNMATRGGLGILSLA